MILEKKENQTHTIKIALYKKVIFHAELKMKNTHFSFLKLSNIVYWARRIYYPVDNGNNH